MSNSSYWDNVYQSKNENEVSWFQQEPSKSLELIDEMKLSLDSEIIDIGAGESRLVDSLLKKGFKKISILDISSASLEKLKLRVGDNSKDIEFICSDVTEFAPVKKYNLWHDRATFHFLTELDQVEKYLKIANESLQVGGFLIISTFALTGPEKCSGLQISRYSQEDLKSLFGRYFENIKCFEDTHVTPWGSKQDFVFCGFIKRND